MFFNTLPSYQGPFPVGFVDIEQAPSDINSDLPGVLLRVYYPAAIDSTSPSTSHWLPDNWNYAKGYGHFLHAPFIAIALLFYPGTLLSHHLLPVALCLTRKRALLHPKVADGKFPICLFSHGLGGMRTTYSQVCGNLASRGVIVVAVEHAEQSAAYTSRLNGKVQIPHRHPMKGEDLDSLLRFRRGQVQQRADECLEAMKVMKELNEGKLVSLLPLQKEAANNAVKQLKGRINFSESIIMGHSFGGATAIKVLDPATKSGIDFKCAVTLDPWMFSVQDCKIKNVPVLNLQSHHFHWVENLDLMKKLIQGRGYHKDSVFGHIRRTSHQDASDFPLLFSYVMRQIKQSGPQHPQLTHMVQDRIIVDFVSKFVTLQDTKRDSSIDEYALFEDESWDELRASL